MIVVVVDSYYSMQHKQGECNHWLVIHTTVASFVDVALGRYNAPGEMWIGMAELQFVEKSGMARWVLAGQVMKPVVVVEWTIVWWKWRFERRHEVGIVAFVATF